MIRNLLLAVLMLASLVSVKGDPFRNLGFEEYDATGLTPGSLGSTSLLLPGWSLSLDGGPVGTTGYNSGIAFEGTSSLFDESPATEGKASFGMTPVYDPLNSRWADWTLSQRGDIPANAHFVSFARLAVGIFKVEVDGNALPLQNNSGFNYADISAYAGKNVELSFITDRTITLGTEPIYVLDAISFSRVPEPRAWVIFSCGILLVIRSRSFL